MKSFDQTYADPDFERELEQARAGWMAQVPRGDRADLHVEGLNGSWLARILGTLTRRR
jgi:hypothetical protein